MVEAGGVATWVIPLSLGVPAFACAFLLPRRRRRRVALFLASVDTVLVLLAITAVVLYLIAEA